MFIKRQTNTSTLRKGQHWFYLEGKDKSAMDKCMKYLEEFYPGCDVGCGDSWKGVHTIDICVDEFTETKRKVELHLKQLVKEFKLSNK